MSSWFRFSYMYRCAFVGAAGGVLIIILLVLLSAAIETELIPFQYLIEIAIVFAALGALAGASYGSHKLGK
jgi:hypothetical protein